MEKKGESRKYTERGRTNHRTCEGVSQSRAFKGPARDNKSYTWRKSMEHVVRAFMDDIIFA